MKKIKNYIILSIISIFFTSLAYGSNSIALSKMELSLEDSQSLKRGAKIFFDQCQGCHSLKYMRYIDLAKGINITETKDKSLIKIIQETLMHSNDQINENSQILGSIYKENGIKWFGKNPPDLSLIARYRGSNWIYSYMKSFYKDPSRPLGVNNLVYPDVGMPHVLLKLQGTQVLKNIHTKTTSNLEELLELTENGELSKEAYDKLVKDLVNFLTYVSEPIKVERTKLGYYVIIFLVILTILMYFLKREYWKEIK
ncbi:MAG TPA: cytochrome c1 [Candidatus Azoamicus sp. OHIO1]